MPRKPQLTKAEVEAKAKADAKSKKAILKKMPSAPQVNPLESVLPSPSKIPPALTRLRSAPQFDESWFSTYDKNPESAKMFRQQMLLKNKGKEMQLFLIFKKKIGYGGTETERRLVAS